MVALENTNDSWCVHQRYADATLLVFDGLRFIIADFESVSSISTLTSFRRLCQVAAFELGATDVIPNTSCHLILLHTLGRGRFQTLRAAMVA